MDLYKLDLSLYQLNLHKQFNVLNSVTQVLLAIYDERHLSVLSELASSRCNET